MSNGYEALRSQAAWLDLSERGKIRVTGEDRARLLHAMSTNHVKGLEANQGLYAFFLNDKGRILADANIYNLATSLFLDTEPETRQKLFDHLDRFIIADDVTLEDETETLAAIGLEGPASLEAAKALGLPFGEAKLSIEAFGSGFTVRTSSTGALGVRIFLPVEEKSALLARLEAHGCAFATAEEARVVRLEHGLARYGDDISERYLVQETQALQATHPNKGCYLGQEIVERVRSRGQVHRLLMPVHVHSPSIPEAGAKIASLEGTGAGEITSAAYSPALGEVVALAYVRTEAANAKPELVLAGSEPPVRISIG